MNWARYKKAMAGAAASGVAAAATAYVSVLADGVTGDEWRGIASAFVLAALGGGGIVAAAPKNAVKS